MVRSVFDFGTLLAINFHQNEQSCGVDDVNSMRQLMQTLPIYHHLNHYGIDVYVEMTMNRVRYDECLHILAVNCAYLEYI